MISDQSESIDFEVEISELLSKESEKYQFANFLKSRLYSRKNTGKVPKKFKPFIIISENEKEKEKRRKKVKVKVKGLPPMKKESSRGMKKSLKPLKMKMKRRKEKGMVEEEEREEEEEEEVCSLQEFIDKIKNDPSTLEFVYLNRAKEGGKSLKPFNPYNLVVTSHIKRHKAEYYTLGAKGVTHFIGGNVEFTPLDSWLKEKELYERIIHQSFFQNFRMWKSFYFMKKTVVKKRTNKAQTVLTKHLFIMNPVLSQPLKRVREVCLELQDIELFQECTGQTLELEEFREIQIKQREKAKKFVVEKIDGINKIVSEACVKYMDDAGFGDRFKSIESFAQLKFDESSEENYEQFQNYNYPYQMSYTDLSQKRRICKELMNFVRLVDYLIYDALINLNLYSVEKMLKKVKYLTENVVEVEEDEESFDFNAENENKAMFVVRVQLNEDDKLLKVHPSKSQFENVLKFVIEGFLKSITPKRLLIRPDYNEYIDLLISNKGEKGSMIEASQDVRALIIKDNHYNELISKILEYHSSSCSKVNNYITSFEELKEIYLENELMDINDIRNASPAKTIDFYRSEMKKYRNQISLVDNMASKKHCGVFFVDSSVLKKTFEPSPKRCLSEYYKLLPELANVLNKDLFKELKDSVDYLGTSPSTIEEFVGYTKFNKMILNRRTTLEDNHLHIAQIYILLDNEGVTVDINQIEEFQASTGNRLARLKQGIEIAEESHSTRKKKFALDISDEFTVLKNKLKRIQVEGRDVKIADEESNPDDVISFLDELYEGIKNIKKRAVELVNYQEMFKLLSEEIENIEEISDDVKLKLKLWNSLKSWTSGVKDWESTEFEEIDVNEMKNKIEENSIIAIQVEKGLAGNVVVEKFSGHVDEWKVILPVISNLKNPFYKTRHLTILDKIVGEEIFVPAAKRKKKKVEKKKGEKEITLGQILQKNILDKTKEIEEIAQRASSEASLEEMVKKVSGHWDDSKFTITNYKEYYILGDCDDIVTQIEDDQIVVSMILSSPFVKPIKERVEKWQHDLKLMFDVIQQWNKLQMKWLYLESVFSSGDKNMQDDLDVEHTKFKEISKFFKEQMKRTNEGRNVRSACTQNMGLLERFKNSNRDIEFIEKKLEQYLDRKRNLFPRLYFLSNDDLLDILSKSKTPHAVQPHLEKCFDNIKKLEFAGSSVDIVSMVSSEGEVVNFYTKNMKARGPIEDWLQVVEKNMIKTLRYLTKDALYDYNHQERTKWIKEHKCQVVITVNQIYWARDVELCLKSKNPIKQLKEYRIKSLRNLNDLAVLSRQKINPLVRRTITTLIITEVHGANVVDDMVKEGVKSIDDFGWLKQLRYYWNRDEMDCVVKQSNTLFHYGYEYNGCKGRLVITPLTDRIYMTMTGALHLKMGGAPAGPAGTGKTETVKDLAKALGYQCIVFNCSEGVTYKMMYKLFSGIVQTGAWTCFDEFNRINIEVLSVIATQIMSIQDALKKGVDSFEFEEGKDPIILKPTCGIFITMNPGYAGRSELPDNLKALFRPVACMIPDYQLIAEVILYSEGYEDAKTLSRKMVQLYKLSNEQLSAQRHYDFGMRAIKSVLVMAGELKRSSVDEDEDITLMKAMRDSNLPKFVGSDINLFGAIVSDLFPSLELEEKVNKRLEKAIDVILKRRKLQNVPEFVKKIIQLYDTMIVRHGVMIVGPTGGGKTASRTVLAESLTYLRVEEKIDYPHFQKIHTNVLNPKSITYSELYGEFNLLTHEFLGGLIPLYAKTFNKDLTPDKKWIIFDGPVDTLWIESMNSVLDDSRLLCLDNGDTIRLNKTIHMLFEVEDLAVASPATVSRCGMVWMDKSNLGWKPFIYSWIDRLPEEFVKTHRDYIRNLFDKYTEGSLLYMRENCVELLPSTDLNLVVSLCELFLGLIKSDSKFSLDKKVDTDLFHLFDHLYVFSLAWSVGGNIVQESRQKFGKFITKKLGSKINQPLTESIYSYFLKMETNSFHSWSEIIPEYKYDPSVPYSQIVVPTNDTVIFSYFLKVLVNAERPILFNGETGVGKTVVVKNTITQLKESHGFELLPVQFSARTTSNSTKVAIESKLVSRKHMLRPQPGKKIVLFVDDLNMPEPEKFGAQPPVELIRQFLQYKGFFDLEDRENIHFKSVEGVSLLSACGPPGGGRHMLSQRAVSFFHLLNVPPLSDASMTKVFQSILEGFLSGGFHESIKGKCKNIVKGSIDIYNLIRDTFRPTPQKAHYTFNLRDLSKVFQGLLQVSAGSIKDDSDSFIRLWVHEFSRCFFDRLNDNRDRGLFFELVINILKRNFKAFPAFKEDLFENKQIVFSTILRVGDDDDVTQVYEEVKKTEKIPKILDDQLALYNIKSPVKMDLVFFNDAAFNCIKIVRIIQQERGNALLVGVGGVGKQSLTRLATHIAGYEIYEIRLKRGYSYVDFREDLQKLFTKTGVNNKRVVFLLTDNQIVDESFLEQINNILNTGEVPNLFPHEEREKIINDLRGEARNAKVSETREAIWKFFIGRVRNNLHIVLTLSPIGNKFRDRCRMFPSLVNCCTIIWFDQWPKEAILSVGKRKFEKIRIDRSEIREKLIDLTVTIHCDVCEKVKDFLNEERRHFYVTPAAFLQFISSYHTLMEKSRATINVERVRLKKGLSILKKTNEEVKKMQKELKRLQPVLVQKTEIARKTREEISKQRQIASSKQQIISEEEKIINEKKKKAENLARMAKTELDKAIPDLKRAEKALGGLTKGAIAEVKNYKEPPPAVGIVLNACQIIYGSTKPTFQEGVKLLSGGSFVTNCKNFNAKNIKEKIITIIKKKYLSNPLFVPDKVRSQSQAAEILCVWIRAVVKFNDVFKTVVPLKEKKEIALKELSKMSKQLKTKQDALNSIESTLKKLNKTLEKNTIEMNDLKDKTDISKKRLEAANKLINSLGSEEINWQKQLIIYDSKINNLPGNCLLGSAAIVYFGPFTASYRKEMFEKWVTLSRRDKIPLSDKCSVTDTFGDKVEIRDWIISKLPSDQQSIENAIIATHSSRWPLMIDPQSQGNTWIKTMNKKTIKVLYMRGNYIRDMENAVCVGTTLLMENIGDSIDGALDPYLDKQISKQQGRTVITIGTQQLDYNENFKFFMTTKLSNPHYLPDICNKTTLINMIVTPTGLEDQLLSDVVQRLERELEEERDKLIVLLARNEKMLKNLRIKILTSLSSVGNRNILDDEEVIKNLDESKFMANVFEQRVKEAVVKERDIDKARKRYRTLAVRGSLLYFVVSKISLIDPMYQYSLEYFKQIFNAVIEKTPKKDSKDRTELETQRLLEKLIDNITATMYTSICMGLFEKDKIVLSFLFASSILKSQNKILDEEYEFFLRGTPDFSVGESPVDFISQNSWQMISSLEKKVFNFSGLLNHIKNNVEKWKKYCKSAEKLGFDAKLPPKWERASSGFRKILLLKCLRREKMISGIRSFVGASLDEKFARSPPLDLKEAISTCNQYTPIIFILSGGCADPRNVLQKFAKDEGFGEKLLIKSLGQGQEESARRYIQRGKQNGLWVMLMNCHLAISFMPELEQIIADLENEEVHVDFKLWLTSLPDKKFPVPILQKGIKITLELPQGIKAQLSRVYNDFEDEYFETFPKEEKFTNVTKECAFKKLLFGLSVFDAVIQERKKFGPTGYCKIYEFNMDFRIAKLWLQIFLSEKDVIPWKSLKYVIGEINYGGRVTDPFDRRLILDIFDEYFTPKILETDYKWADADIYKIPQNGSIEFYRNYIKSLPNIDSPDIFKMHENADIVFQLQESTKLLSTLGTVNPKSLGGGPGGKNVEEYVKEKLNNILAKLPSPLLQKECKKKNKDIFKPTSTGALHSLSSVLSHEMERYNKLLKVIEHSLKELLKAVDGLVVLSSSLEIMLNEILNGKVPQLWKNKAYESLKTLDTWITDLIERIQFLRNWVVEGTPNSFWISGFFFPQGFLTGVLQTHARKYKIPIDTLEFKFKVLKITKDDIKNPPEDGVYVYGMFLDGAEWDKENESLVEPERGKMINTIPVVHFLPEQNHQKSNKLYDCPLYKTSERKGNLTSWGQSSNFVCIVELPSTKRQEFWSLQGLALICETDK